MKKVSRSLSKKWSSVRGNNNNNDKNNIIIDTTTDDNMNIVQAPIPPLPSSTSSCPSSATAAATATAAYADAVADFNNSKKKTVPEVTIVSDTSSEEEDSSSDEDAAQYGYGDASPDANENVKLPKRLSTRANSIRLRRTSSNSEEKQGDGDDENLNLPFDPQRIPKRSSIKGTCPARARARRHSRRASIATCTATLIEKELAAGLLQPSQILEIRVPFRRESIKRRTSITFNEDINVRKIQPLKEMQGATKGELWFQDKEYTQIKNKTRALIEKVDPTSGLFDGKKYCTRGLEKYMEDPIARQSKKYMGWDSVLMEQEKQRLLEIYDDESIGKFYKPTSTGDVVEATNRATLDAQEVASFYNTNNTNQTAVIIIPTTTTVVATTTTAAIDAADHVPDMMTGLKTRMKARRGRRASVA